MSEIEYGGRKAEHEHYEKEVPVSGADSKELDTAAVNSLIHDPKNWWNWGFVYQCM